MSDGWRGVGPLARLIAPVRAYEWRAVGLGAAYFFLLLTSYFLIRPVREAMGIDRGYDKLPLLMTGTLIAMVAVNPLFSLLVSRTPRRNFIAFTHRFLIVNLLFFFVMLRFAGPEKAPWLGYAFYIWVSVFNLFITSIFWAVMIDVFGREGGSRVFGLIGVGGTLGAIVGAAAAGTLVNGDIALPGITLSFKPLDVSTLLLFSAVVLEGATWCARGVLALRIEPRDTTSPRAADPTSDPFAGLRMLVTRPYLQLIAWYMLIFTITSTLLYMEQARIISETFPDREARVKAFANLDMYSNVVTLAAQIFVTRHVITKLGMTTALCTLPVISIVGFIVLHASPSVGALMVFQVVRRGVHYAIDRPARELLYSVLGADARYKAKSLVDTFVYRAGDMIGAWAHGPLGAAILGAAIGCGAASLVIAGILGRTFRHSRDGATGPEGRPSATPPGPAP